MCLLDMLTKFEVLSSEPHDQVLLATDVESGGNRDESSDGEECPHDDTDDDCDDE